MMKTYKLFLSCLLLALLAAVSGCSDDLWRVNTLGSQLTESGGYRLSTFELDEGTWNIPDSVRTIDIRLTSHTDDSELCFEADCEHADGMHRITLKIPAEQSIPDSDYEMRGFLKDGKGLNKCITVTFRDEMLHAHLAVANSYCLTNGTGTKDDPYLIEGQDDFLFFLEGLKDGDTTHGKDLYFKQTADFSAPFVNEATNGRGYRGEAFAGHYDGGGHYIKFTFKGSEKQPDQFDDNVGLFTKLLDGADIKNLTIKPTISWVRNKGGALAGSTSGKVTVSNVTVDGFIHDCKTEIGGLVGVASGELRVANYGFLCEVKGTEKVGGLVGSATNATIVVNKMTTMDGTSAGNFAVNASVGKGGGVVGYAEKSTIDLQYVTLQWSLDVGQAIDVIYGGSCMGGLVGEASIQGKSTISYCTVSAPVSGSGDYVGGLVGKAQLNSDLIVCYNKEHSTVSGRTHVGGFFGHLTCSSPLQFSSLSENEISNRIAQSSSADIFVIGDENVGGLFGYLQGTTNVSGIHRINVNVTARTQQAGGIVGSLKSNTLDVAHFDLSENMRVIGHQSIGGLVGYAEDCTIQGGNTVAFDDGIPNSTTFKSNYAGSVECDATKTGTNMGGIVGYAKHSSIKNVCITGQVGGTGRVGGIVGYLQDGEGTTLSHCASCIAIEKDLNLSGDEIGGIAGRVENVSGTFENLINYTNVNADNYTGGVIGHLVTQLNASNSDSFTLKYAVNVGKVSGTKNVGGVVGYSSGQDGRETLLDYCANYGNVSNSEEGNVGGIMGHGNRTKTGIFHSANHGRVTGGQRPSKVGGIVGRIGKDASFVKVHSNMEMAECCNRGVISAGHNDSHVGGLAGYQEEGHDGDPTHWMTHDCYNADSVTTKHTHNTGGVVGRIDHYGEIVRCINIGHVIHGNGVVGTRPSSGILYTHDLYYLEGTGKHWKNRDKSFKASQKKDKATFNNFDFNKVWAIDSDGTMNNGFPYLQDCPFQSVYLDD